MVTPSLYEYWILNTAIVSRPFLSIRLLEHGFIAAAWNPNPVNRIVALASLDTWTTSGKMIPFAPESVFRGGLTSLCRSDYFRLSRFLPDPRKFVLAFVAWVMLIGSTWTRKLAERLRVSRHFELFSRSELKGVEVDLFNGNVDHAPH